jgi:hypothetical protein
MTNQETLQRYINDFRRHIAPYLRPSVGLSCTVYPAQSSGAILVFTLGQGVLNEDRFQKPVATVNDALTTIPQKAFGGQLRGFHFGGTNIVMEDQRIILIKGDDSPSTWNDRAALDDVKRLFQRPAPGESSSAPAGTGATR